MNDRAELVMIRIHYAVLLYRLIYSDIHNMQRTLRKADDMYAVYYKSVLVPQIPWGQ